MTETAEKLKIELSQLSTNERAELAYFLIHSLDEGYSLSATMPSVRSSRRRLG
jgi:hypothetical protein